MRPPTTAEYGMLIGVGIGLIIGVFLDRIGPGLVIGGGIGLALGQVSARKK